MDAKTYFTNDIKDISGINVDGTLAAADKITDRYSDAASLLASKFWASLNAKSEWAILTAFMAMADTEGRGRVGAGSLADDIVAQQAARVRQYGEKAYRLSEKQATVVINSAFAYIFQA